MQRQLEAYNAKNLAALVALYDDDYTALMHKAKRKEARPLEYDTYKKAAVSSGYGKDFQHFPTSRVKVVERSFSRDGIGTLLITEVREPVNPADQKLFLELREVVYTYRGGKLLQGRYYHSR